MPPPNDAATTPAAVPRGATSHQDADARALLKLGYKQELGRVMGGFANFALAFSIISVLTGVVSTYGQALKDGGPGGVVVGWALVSGGTSLVALAMAELASAFPTAGALYHWSAVLGGRGFGWMTAATNIVGQIAIVGGIELACAQALADAGGCPSSFVLPLMVGVVVAHGVLNALSAKTVARSNAVSAAIHVGGVLILVVLLFGAVAKPFSSAFVFTSASHPTYALGFLNALLLGMWTFTGYDASAHASEETHDPARRAPLGILTAVAISAVCGLFLVLALTLAIRDLPAVIASKTAPLDILVGALGPAVGRAALALVAIAMWFCGLASVTSAARTLYAFARDGGLPFSAVLSRVNPRTKTPIAATVIATLVPLALVVTLNEASEAAFQRTVSLATTALYVSYALPIAAGATARLSGRWKRMGPFSLGRAGIPIAGLAVLWSGFVLVATSAPPNLASGGLLAGVLLFLAALYFGYARKAFRGPSVTVESLSS